MKVEHEPAFVLHARAYRETSQLVDLFTPNFGRIRVVSRGSRKSRKLQPFSELTVSWVGNGELKTLAGSEQLRNQIMLKGIALYSGLYLNELLVRLLCESDCHLTLFEEYRETLGSLAGGEYSEAILRKFELLMLQELGYGLELTVDATTGAPIERGLWYQFEPDNGFYNRSNLAQDKGKNWFPGDIILKIHSGDYSDINVRRDAKRLIRLALQPLLGGKPLQSRQLFTQMIHRR